MKRFTRLLSIFLAVLMLSSVLTTVASAITWDFDSDNGVVTPGPVEFGPVDPGTDSAIVRVYVKGTGTEGYSKGQVPGYDNLWVDKDFVIVKDGDNVSGIKANDLTNAESVIRSTTTLIPTVTDAVNAVNARKTADNNGATLLKADDYCALAISEVKWEVKDSAYHVHLTFVKKGDLVITANSYSVTYDGNVYAAKDYTLTGTLKEGHRIANVTLSGSGVDAGTYTLIPSGAKIVDAYGNDVTTQYNITYVNGTLTIAQRPLTIAAGTNSWPYDGNWHSDNYWQITSGTLAANEQVRSVTVTGSIRDVGSADNVPSNANIYHNLRRVDTTKNYAITYVNGTLTITGKQYTPNPEYVDDYITICKVDSSNRALSGAKFTLYNGDQAIYTGTTGSDGKLIISTKDISKYLPTSGSVTFTLRETQAPSGYNYDSRNYWNVTVSVSEKERNNNNGTFTKIYAYTMKVNNSSTLTVENSKTQTPTPTPTPKPDTTSFTIRKRDSAYQADDMIREEQGRVLDSNGDLPGAWFDLYDSSYVLRSGKYDTKAKPIDSQKTDKYGEATFSKLAAGTYYLVEYSAPSGYTKDNTVYRIDVRVPSGSIDKKLVAFITAENAISNRSLTEANGYTIYNTKTVASYGTVTVSKEVSGIGTSSKTKYSFEIWEKNGKKALKSFTLTAGSSTTISLDPGSYIIKELDASKVGYELKTYIDGSLSRTGQTSFTVKAGGKTSIAYKNVYAASIDLNTEDHYAYIIGYEDGTVRPNGNLTRAEVATIFFRMLTDDARSKYWCTTNNYTDVSSDDWFNNAVSTLSYAGIINGYSDGSFQPKGTITRAELVKMAMGFFNYTTGSSSSRFTDVGDHWAASYINKAAELGYLDIFGSTFEPNKAITRAEAITIINRVLGRSPHKDYMNIRQTYWSDNPTSAWYYADIQEATNSHDYTWINIYGNQYEEWTSALENRDWAALEKKWSTTYSSHNPGNVW